MKITARLGSDEHYQSTVTRNYGEFDPIAQTRDHINLCHCGKPGVLANDAPSPTPRRATPAVEPSASYWYVYCQSCQTNGPATRNNWQAILDWNRGPLSKKPSYGDLPLFGLAPLTPEEALARLNSIRLDLELRIKEARHKRDDKTIPEKDKPGGRYVARMRAYLAWAIYAQTLLKLEKTKITEHLLRASPGKADK
jgi:hypothetical protein